MNVQSLTPLEVPIYGHPSSTGFDEDDILHKFECDEWTPNKETNIILFHNSYNCLEAIKFIINIMKYNKDKKQN